MSEVSVDDNSPNVSYSGAWIFQPGSTRQWDGGVHVTSQPGASASVTFKATTAIVIGTIPEGSGQQAFVDIQLDDMQPISIVLVSSSAAVYANVMWTSPTLTEATHTITMTNRGGDDDLSFMFDVLQLEATGFVPSVLAPQLPNGNASTALLPTMLSSPYALPKTTQAKNTQVNPEATVAPLSATFTQSNLQPNVTQTKLTPLWVSATPTDILDPGTGVGITGTGGDIRRSSVSLGGIIGGTLGGVFFMLILSWYCIILRRRHRSKMHLRNPNAFRSDSEGRSIVPNTQPKNASTPPESLQMACESPMQVTYPRAECIDVGHEIGDDIYHLNSNPDLHNGSNTQRRENITYRWYDIPPAYISLSRHNSPAL